MLSVNLTTRQSIAVDPAIYSAPLLITGSAVVCEMVWWDPHYGWVVMVRDPTGRTYPPGVIEVTPDWFGV